MQFVLLNQHYIIFRVSLRGRHWASWVAVRVTLPNHFNQWLGLVFLMKNFSSTSFACLWKPGMLLPRWNPCYTVALKSPIGVVVSRRIARWRHLTTTTTILVIFLMLVRTTFIYSPLGIQYLIKKKTKGILAVVVKWRQCANPLLVEDIY